jgi:hypothetical protein
MSSKISVLIIVLLAAASILTSTLQAARAQQQQPQPQTAQGLPIVIVPAIIGNILAVVSFLIGTSSFILGLRIQSAARTTTTGSTSSSSSSSATLPSSEMHKYFELLILALVIPSIGINAYGILLVGSHLYLPDAPYLSLLFALFIPAGAILFLVKKLHIAYKTNISSG